MVGTGACTTVFKQYDILKYSRGSRINVAVVKISLTLNSGVVINVTLMRIQDFTLIVTSVRKKYERTLAIST